jgi:hypothetical protein
MVGRNCEIGEGEGIPTKKFDVIVPDGARTGLQFFLFPFNDIGQLNCLLSDLAQISRILAMVSSLTHRGHISARTYAQPYQKAFLPVDFGRLWSGRIFGLRHFETSERIAKAHRLVVICLLLRDRFMLGT